MELVDPFHGFGMHQDALFGYEVDFMGNCMINRFPGIGILLDSDVVDPLVDGFGNQIKGLLFWGDDDEMLNNQGQGADVVKTRDPHDLVSMRIDGVHLKSLLFQLFHHGIAKLFWIAGDPGNGNLSG